MRNADQSNLRPAGFGKNNAHNGGGAQVRGKKVHKRFVPAANARAASLPLREQQSRELVAGGIASTGDIGPGAANHGHVYDRVDVFSGSSAIRQDVCGGDGVKEEGVFDAKYGELGCTAGQDRNALTTTNTITNTTTKKKFDLSLVQLEKLRAALARVSLEEEEKCDKEKTGLLHAIRARLELLQRVDIKTRICEPFFGVVIAGRAECSRDLDFLMRFRVQKKMAVFEHLHVVLDLRGLCCDCDASGFFSAWALFVLARCDRFTVIEPRDSATRELVYMVVRAVNEAAEAVEEGPVAVMCGDEEEFSALLPVFSVFLAG